MKPTALWNGDLTKGGRIRLFDGALMSERRHRFLSLLAASVALSACALPQPSASPSAPIQARTLMETLSSWDGKGLQYPAGIPKVTALEIVVAPGADPGWHLHPVPSLGVPYYPLPPPINLRCSVSDRFLSCTTTHLS